MSLNLHLVVPTPSEVALERDLISHLLMYSHEETTLTIFSEEVLTLFNKHPLLKNRAVAIWKSDIDNSLSIMASQNLNAAMQKSLDKAISYKHYKGQFLTTRYIDLKGHSDQKLNRRLDIYLEKTKYYLCGVSFWDTKQDVKIELTRFFFNEFFNLINLIFFKIYYKDRENNNMMEEFFLKKEDEKKQYYQATCDYLTHLPNRFVGYSLLEHAISRAKNNKTKLAILFLDLDEFKHINDSWGHEVGDLALKAVFERYIHVLKKTDSLVRLGGDEFMVILENIEEEIEAEKIAKKYQELSIVPYTFKSKRLFISSSIGIAFFPEHGTGAKILMQNADIAMYQSKMKGKNNYTLFINTMAEVLTHRSQITIELHQVLDRNELYICYQPIINIKDNKVFAAEALLRWNSATLGSVMPEQIIPIAEATGLIIPLGYWILNKVCSYIKERQLKTGEQIKIAVNISMIQLKQKDFVYQVKSILKQKDVSPESLIFEITESAFIDDSVLILKQLNELTKMNIDCSLDDFGMGYSSLNYIRSYPFKSLKIDKAFIHGIDRSNDDLNLVHSIISLSKSLNLLVIAEGIETREQLDLLRSMSCDMVQGWYFSKALDKERYLSYLNNK